MMLLHMVRSHVATDRDDDDSTRCLFLHYVSSTYPCVFKVAPSQGKVTFRPFLLEFCGVSIFGTCLLLGY